MKKGRPVKWAPFLLSQLINCISIRLYFIESQRKLIPHKPNKIGIPPCAGESRAAACAPLGKTMENNKSTAYAFMIMLAGLAVIGHYGRASAEVAPPSAYESAMPGQASMQRAPGYAPQYGLIQTAVVGVAHMDGNGAFGRPAAMPVFQIVQLQPATAPAQASYEAPNIAPQAPVASAEPSVPQGMTVTPPAAQMAGALCDIKGIRVLTQNAESCVMAGGQTVTQ